MSPAACRLRRLSASGIVGAAFILLTGASLAAQQPATLSAAAPGWLAELQVEARGGLTVGSHSASGAALDIAPRISVEGLARLAFTSRFAAFVGYARTAFGCDEGFCQGQEISIVGNHGMLGGEFRYGTPWVRAGVLIGTTRAGTEGEDPEIGVGFQVSSGFAIAAGRFRILPGISYRRLSAATATASDHASTLALDLGLGYTLRGGQP